MSSKHFNKEGAQRSSYLRSVIIGLIAIAVLIASGFTYGALRHATIAAFNTPTQPPVGRLQVTIQEDYPGHAPIKNAIITIDGRRLSLDNKGRITVDSLSPGRHTIAFTHKLYEPFSLSLATKKGPNTLVLRVCLSAVEAGKRWMKTKQENLHQDTYALLHPDERTRIKQADYIRFKTDVLKAYNVKIDKFYVYPPEYAAIWKHPKTGKAYKNVAIMRVDSIVTVDKLGTVKQRWYIAAQRVNNRWLFLSGL
ncbi:MAG TPA: hypothetical protein VGK02_08555 [Candidatus Aquicultor sp.]